MKNAIMAIQYTREKQNVGFEQTSKSITGVIIFFNTLRLLGKLYLNSSSLKEYFLKDIPEFFF